MLDIIVGHVRALKFFLCLKISRVGRLSGRRARRSFVYVIFVCAACLTLHDLGIQAGIGDRLGLSMHGVGAQTVQFVTARG